MILLVKNNLCSKGTKRNINNIIKKINKIYHELIVIDFMSLKDINLNYVNIIIICGGDGSVNQIVNETYLYNIKYTIVPLGTGNDIYKNLKKYPNNTNWNVIKINDKIALYAISIGDISPIIINTKLKQKKLLRKFSYVLNSLKILILKKKIYLIKVNNKTYLKKAKGIIIVNSSFLGGFKINLLRTRKYKIFVIYSFLSLIKMFIFSRKYLDEFNEESEALIKVLNYDNNYNICVDGEDNNSKRIEIKSEKRTIIFTSISK